MPTLVPIRAVKDVLREVRNEAREQGRREGREEATRMLEWAVQLNGHGPAVLKSLREGSDAGGRVADRVPGADPDRGVAGGVDGRTGPQKEDLTDDDVNDAVTLAAIDALIEAKTHGAESGPIYDYLVSLLGDSDALRAAVDVQAKAFDESKHPRGDDGRFIGRERIHAAKSDPALADKLREQTTDPEERKKLEAALAGEVDTGRTKAGLHRERVAAAKKEKADRIARVRELADDMSMARRGGEPVPAEKYRELMEHLPALSIKELRSVREKLAASFWTRTRREDMVTALVRHARIRAEQAEYDAKHADDDPLDFGMLGEVESRPTDRRNEDLNPWHETDKLDAGAYGEAQHGGRMYQRHMLASEHGVKDTVAYNERGADVKPEWRDDSGKPVDTITSPKDDEDWSGAKKLKDRKPQSKPKTDTLYSHVVGAGGIDPKSMAFLAHYSGVNHAVEDGLSRGLFNHGGRGLDQIVQELWNNGHISGADEAEATENLLEGLRNRAKSNHADRTKEYDDALLEFQRKQQEAHDAGLEQSDIADTLRRGEEDARREDSEGAGGSGGEALGGDPRGVQDAPGDAAEPEGEVDTSFDFGNLEPAANAPSANSSESPKSSANPEVTPTQPASKQVTQDAPWSQANQPPPAAPPSTPEHKAGGVLGKAPHEMTKAEFNKAGFYQHTNLRDDNDLTGQSFKFGIGPNLVYATQGTPTDVMQIRYGTRAGKQTVVVPPHAVHHSGNGPKIKPGYVVEHSVVPSRDHQPLHEAAVEHALKNGKAVPQNVLEDYPDLAAKYGQRITPQPAPQPTPEHKAGDRVARRQRGGYPVGGQVVEVYKSQRDGTMLAKVKWDNGQTTSVKFNAIKPENKDEIAAARQAWKEKHGKA